MHLAVNVPRWVMETVELGRRIDWPVFPFGRTPVTTSLAESRMRFIQLAGVEYCPFLVGFFPLSTDRWSTTVVSSARTDMHS